MFRTMSLALILPTAARAFVPTCAPLRRGLSILPQVRPKRLVNETTHTARKKELCPLILTLSQVNAGVSPSSAALRFRGGGVRPLSATAAPISIVVQVRVQIRYDVR